jgi:hypothetical protein
LTSVSTYAIVVALLTVKRENTMENITEKIAAARALLDSQELEK